MDEPIGMTERHSEKYWHRLGNDYELALTNENYYGCFVPTGRPHRGPVAIC
jgi:hypothetical protein